MKIEVIKQQLGATLGTHFQTEHKFCWILPNGFSGWVIQTQPENGSLLFYFRVFEKECSEYSIFVDRAHLVLNIKELDNKWHWQRIGPAAQMPPYAAEYSVRLRKPLRVETKELAKEFFSVLCSLSYLQSPCKWALEELEKPGEGDIIHRGVV